jgi:hypothetical protein
MKTENVIHNFLNWLGKTEKPKDKNDLLNKKSLKDLENLLKKNWLIK